MPTRLEVISGIVPPPPAPAARNIECARCRDVGYVLPIAVAREFEHWIPAGVLYREGLPCTCAAGIEFAAQQFDWNLPIPPRAPAEIAEDVPAVELVAIAATAMEEPAAVTVQKLPSCRSCDGEGHVRTHTGRTWCTCPAASRLRQQDPEFICRMNASAPVATARATMLVAPGEVILAQKRIDTAGPRDVAQFGEVLHANPPAGHVVTMETRSRDSWLIEWDVCSCGWEGPWRAAGTLKALPIARPRETLQ